MGKHPRCLIYCFYACFVIDARYLGSIPAISQSHLQRQFNELILVRVAAFGEGLEDLREKKGL